MPFGNAFDEVTGFVRVVIRRRKKFANLIRTEDHHSKPVRHEVDNLADLKFVSHKIIRS